MRFHFIRYYYNRFKTWCKYQRNCLNGTAVQVGDYYEDCGFIPRQATVATAFDIQGRSLVAAHGPNSVGSCDPWHCGVVKLTKDRAEWQAIYGPWSFDDSFYCRGVWEDHKERMWWTPIPEWLSDILAVPHRPGIYDMVARNLQHTSLTELNNILAYAHWFEDRPTIAAAIYTKALRNKGVLTNFDMFAASVTL